jgi:hypothetical protein
MAITDWKIGQQVVDFNDGRNSDKVRLTIVRKLGRKIVTTQDGSRFDASKSPAEEVGDARGWSSRLYSLTDWDEVCWRSKIRRALEGLIRVGNPRGISLEDWMQLSKICWVAIPTHLQPKQEERIDELLDADGNAGHGDNTNGKPHL